MAEASGKPVKCANCGLLLDEPSDLPSEERRPCPRCGSTSREFHGRASLTIGFEVRTDATVISPPEPAQPATEDLVETGYRVVWYRYPDGLFFVQVFDDSGELIDGGGGDDPVDAILGVAERLLPPGA